MNLHHICAVIPPLHNETPQNPPPLHTWESPVTSDTTQSPPQSSPTTRAAGTHTMEMKRHSFDVDSRPAKSPIGDRPHPPPKPPETLQNDNMASLDLVFLQGTRVNQVGQRYDGVRDAREGLLGSRYRLQHNRQEVRKARQKLGVKEGLAVSRLRRYLHEQAMSLPSDIQKSLEDVFAMKDRLGSLEVDYDTAEDLYNHEEIQYTDREAELVSIILDSNPSAEPAGTAHPGVIETRNFALGSGNSEEHESHGKHPLNMAALGLHDGPHEVYNHDNEQSQNLARWEATETRINYWLMDLISVSAIERMHLKALDPSSSLERDSWWPKVAAGWNLDIRPPEKRIIEQNASSIVDKSEVGQLADIELMSSKSVESEELQRVALFPSTYFLDTTNNLELPSHIDLGDNPEP